MWFWGAHERKNLRFPGDCRFLKCYCSQCILHWPQLCNLLLCVKVLCENYATGEKTCDQPDLNMFLNSFTLALPQPHNSFLKKRERELKWGGCPSQQFSCMKTALGGNYLTDSDAPFGVYLCARGENLAKCLLFSIVFLWGETGMRKAGALLFSVVSFSIFPHKEEQMPITVQVWSNA